MKNKILLTLVLLIPSLCFGKEYTSLKDPDYKNLRLIIEGVNESHSGLTKQDILNEVKLLCLQNGIKASEEGSGDFLYINVCLLKAKTVDVFDVDVKYIKFSPPLSSMRIQTGVTYTPDQGIYSSLGMGYQKEFILGFLRTQLKKFLVDYLESNIE